MESNTETSQFRVGVVGMGPTGSTLAAHFVDAGAYVVACDVDHIKIDLIREEGIKIEGLIQRNTPVNGACYDLKDLGEHDLDLVAISVKAAGLKNVVSVLADTLPEKTNILCVQNGLDNELEVSQAVGEERTLRMVVNYAGALSAPNTVRILFFNSPNYIASMSPVNEPMSRLIATMLSSVGLTTKSPGDIKRYIWEKTILNAAMAPGAIARLTMKEIMDSSEAVEVVKEIINESIRVAKAEGVEFGDDFLEFCVDYLKKGGHHRPSMAVDLGFGRLTEINYLNGRIAAYGVKHGVPTPYNQIVTTLVHLMEQPSNNSANVTEVAQEVK